MQAIELQDRIKVKGARGLEKTLDISKLDAAMVERILDYWFGVVTSRASAGVDDFPDKVKAEQAMADKLATFDWSKGGGGGGARLSLADQANRDVLTDLFKGQGIKKTEAEKRARGDSAWRDFIRLGLARALNRSDITDDEVKAELERQQPAISGMVKDREEFLKAEEERAAKLAKSGLTFGTSDEV